MYDLYLLWIIIAATVFTVAYFFRKHVRIRIRKRRPDGTLEPIRIKDPKIIAQIQFQYGYQQAQGMFARGEYTEAIRAFEEVLGMRAPEHLKGAVRSILADCYDGIGDTKRAEEERERAEAALSKGKLDFTGAVALANLLTRKGKYLEACGAYEQALAQVPNTDNDTRQKLLVKLAQTARHGGRTEDALEWASQAIQYGATGQILMAAHSVAALCYTDMGQLDRAEQHRNTAAALARGDGDNTAVAVQMATQSGLLCSKGRFDEALALADKALEITGGTSIAVHENRYKVLRALDRDQEALEAIQAARRLASAQPSPEANRIIAAHSLVEAGLHAEMGNTDAAVKLIEEVKVLRADDSGVLLTCDAVMATVLATAIKAAEKAAGGDPTVSTPADTARREEARRILDAADKTVASTELSRIKALEALGCLFHAAYDLGDFVMTKRLVEQCLELKPNPSSMPAMYYYLGECQRNMGDLESARRSYQEALAVNIETPGAKKARARLAEMDGG